MYIYIYIYKIKLTHLLTYPTTANFSPFTNKTGDGLLSLVAVGPGKNFNFEHENEHFRVHDVTVVLLY